jgi:hypothetical protein
MHASLPLVPLVILAVASAHCSPAKATADAGLDDADLDVAVPVEANASLCPTFSSVIELGTPCGWSGTCTVSLDLCGTGGVSTASVCTDGVVALPGGGDASCPASTVPFCAPNTPCTGSGQCQVNGCGDGLMCECVEGAWYCPMAFCPDAGPCGPGVACGPDGTVCTNFGAGPCGSDQRLVCTAGVYVTDGFLCGTSASGCDLPPPDAGGCPRVCACSDWIMTCLADCDEDGG